MDRPHLLRKETVMIIAKQNVKKLDSVNPEKTSGTFSANRRYKDSLFSDLFYADINAKDNLVQLYNSLFESESVETSDIDLLRLEQTMFMSMHNDVAFAAHGRRIVLSEHQSTINENLPLRFLMYIGREYESILPTKWRYRRNRVSIPTPQFITFYNGSEPYPQESVLKLSDAFKYQETDAGILGSQPQLELAVKVVNINPEARHPLLGKCQVLREYSTLVELIRHYGETEAGIRKAITECIQKNILKEYLERKGLEAVNMLLAEYNYEDDINEQREESRAEGHAEGRAEGRAEGQAEGESKLATLITRLFSLGRGAEVERVASDETYRKQLFKELHIQ